MSKLDFTKEEYEMLIEKCMFNEELSKILEYKIKDYSIVQIAMKMNMSERTVCRRLKQIKNKIKKVI